MSLLSQFGRITQRFADPAKHGKIKELNETINELKQQYEEESGFSSRFLLTTIGHRLYFIGKVCGHKKVSRLGMRLTGKDQSDFSSPSFRHRIYYLFYILHFRKFDLLKEYLQEWLNESEFSSFDGAMILSIYAEDRFVIDFILDNFSSLEKLSMLCSAHSVDITPYLSKLANFDEYASAEKVIEDSRRMMNVLSNIPHTEMYRHHQTVLNYFESL